MAEEATDAASADERSESSAPGTGSGEKPESGSEAKGKGDGERESFLQRNRDQLFVGAILIVLASILATFNPGNIFGPLDSFRDFWRSAGGKAADTHREEIQDLAIWRDKPETFDSSFDFIAQAYPETLAQVEDGRVTYSHAEEVIDEAPSLAGVPISLVGRVVDARSLGREAFDDRAEREVVLKGPDDSGEVRVFVASTAAEVGAEFLKTEVGDIVVVRGLVTAKGGGDSGEGASRDVVCLYATTGFEIADPGSDSSELGRIVRDLERAG